MISLENKFLFIHVPKTGLMYLLRTEDMLMPPMTDNIGMQHSTLSYYQNLIKRSIYDSLYKFCVVRNPWELLISYYFSPHWFESKDPYFKEHPHDKLEDPEELIYYLETDLKPLRYYISTNRKRVLTDEMDYIIRFDDLESDFVVVMDKLGLSYDELPHKNKAEHNQYRQYYNDKLKDMVYRKFKEEINFFHFEF